MTNKIRNIIVKALKLNNSSDIFNKMYYTTESSLRNYWKKLIKHAGLKDFRIHDLRHSFASISLETGCSLEYIRVLLGHNQSQPHKDIFMLKKRT